ncbi:hypothetical protein Hamer_G002770 [Homarus americanus]|uniref:Uncharacterized protein n=1 Tax=Homarus americanus TaxID=6706 RepID=A0A8J5K213_HOMAM|nr:hypothetical protein Hamer_G002770 [Homarus americanus]
MGLTESNQSKGASGWGPSKSRSTPHFPDGRSYQNRPRQAATLPARPTPDSGHPPPYNLPRTPVHDPGALGHDPRPPEVVLHRRDGPSLADRSPGHRSMPPRRSASADSVKRRSDPLLDSVTIKQIPQVKALHRDNPSMFSSRPAISPPSSPRPNSRPRPTAIYVADDQVAHLVRHREGRPRERGHHSRVPHSGTRGLSGEEGRERTRSSCERRQRGIHVSTLTLTPQCLKESGSRADDQPRPTPRHQRRKKDNNKPRTRVEYSASEGLQGDPYVSLHYGGTLDDGQKKQLQQVTAWRTGHEEEKVSRSNSQLSQVVIRMNQVSATTLDNYDAVNANVESVQMRRNVWFHANRTADTSSERPPRNTTKPFNSPALSDHSLGGNMGETDMIRWPDVTSKVSSLYMRPEMHIAAVSCIREGREIVYGSDSPTSGHGTNSYRTSSPGYSGLARHDPSGREHEYVRTRESEKQRGGSSEQGAARQFSIYDDRRNYSKAPGRRKKKSVMVPMNTEKRGERRLASLPTTNLTQLELTSRIKGEPTSESVMLRHSRSDDEIKKQTENILCSPSNAQNNYYSPPNNLREKNAVFPPINTQVENFTSTSNKSQSADNIDTSPDMAEDLSSPDSAAQRPDNIDKSPNKALAELKFGLNNHVEDYTIIEGNGVVSHYYGCGDSDQEPDDSPSSARLGYEPLSAGSSRPASVMEESVCEDTRDSVAASCDSADKDYGADSHWCKVNSLTCTCSEPEEDAGCSPSRVKQVLDDTPPTYSQDSGQYLLKDQCSLPGDILPQKHQSEYVDQPESRAYAEALRVLEEKRWADTLSGYPSALSHSHQCLNKWTSLPRHLQPTSPNAAHSVTPANKMKGFRNRFRSLDVGNFSVLRLPLGNQPRLVDVLRGAVPRVETTLDPPQETALGEEEHNDHTGKVTMQPSGEDPGSNEAVTLVSYSQCCPSPPAPGKDEHSNGCGALEGTECDAPGGDGVISPESDGSDVVTEGEPLLFLDDSEMATIRKSEATVGRHARKRSWSRPSVHTIDWDTDQPPTPPGKAQYISCLRPHTQLL